MTLEVKPPYMLVLYSTDWTGNFEREIIGYSMGILDNVQMSIDYADEERRQFWADMKKENANEDLFPHFNMVPGYYEANDEYPLMCDFLLETYQEVDDWSQNTFYNVQCGKNELSLLTIQLARPLSSEYENVIISRMIKYCKKNNINLTALKLLGPANKYKKGQAYYGKYKVMKKYV